MRYDWLWRWGDGPAEGMRGGEPYKTEGAAIAAGQRHRAKCIAYDQKLAEEDTRGYWKQFIRAEGTITAVPYEEPGPVIFYDG